MPELVRSGQRYMPGLDGLRALAVLAVIAYHEQLAWAPGGLLGVGVFFTLSGYLITDLLLGQWARSGGLNLGDFWLRRARRLLPALFVMLAVVTAWVTVVSPSRLASLRGAVAAAATYSSNWFYIYTHNSYFARFAPPGPFDHLWSLAVEEQFYLVWPGCCCSACTSCAACGPAQCAVWCCRPWYWPPRQPWRCSSSITPATTRRGSTRAPTPAPAACWSGRRWPWSGPVAVPPGPRSGAGSCWTQPGSPGWP